jgi:hypothetical protein
MYIRNLFLFFILDQSEIGIRTRLVNVLDQALKFQLIDRA